MALRYSEARKGGALMIRRFLADLIGALCVLAMPFVLLFAAYGAGLV